MSNVIQRIFYIVLLGSCLIVITSCSGGGTAGTGGSSVLRATIVGGDYQPLMNVTATILDDNQMSTSDESGNFSLSIPRSGGTLSMQFDGAGLQEASLSLELPESDGAVVVIFEGNAEENSVTPTDIKVVEKPSNSSSKPSSSPVAGSTVSVDPIPSPSPFTVCNQPITISSQAIDGTKNSETAADSPSEIESPITNSSDCINLSSPINTIASPTTSPSGESSPFSSPTITTSVKPSNSSTPSPSTSSSEIPSTSPTTLASPSPSPKL